MMYIILFFAFVAILGFAYVAKVFLWLLVEAKPKPVLAFKFNRYLSPEYKARFKKSWQESYINKEYHCVVMDGGDDIVVVNGELKVHEDKEADNSAR